MRKTALTVVVIIACAAVSLAQTQPAQQKSLAATMNVYVFPTKGQTAEQQSTDEASCYNWAVQNTGSDPLMLIKFFGPDINKEGLPLVKAYMK